MRCRKATAQRPSPFSNPHPHITRGGVTQYSHSGDDALPGDPMETVVTLVKCDDDNPWHYIDKRLENRTFINPPPLSFFLSNTYSIRRWDHTRYRVERVDNVAGIQTKFSSRILLVITYVTSHRESPGGRTRR